MSEHASGAQLSYGWSLGPQARMLFLIGILFSAFQIITASFSPLSSTIVRAVHVGFLMLMTFGIAAAVRPRFDAVAGVLWVTKRRRQPLQRRIQARWARHLSRFVRANCARFSFTESREWERPR